MRGGPVPVRALLLGALLLLCDRGAAAQLAPDARWWSFDTERFRVHFHDPALEPVARRAAGHAETAYDEIARGFVGPPPGRIDLVVADNSDVANGFAISFPRNVVAVYVHPPVDEPSLSFFDDWLALVIAHELTHVFHLDQVSGIWRPLRRVFGRTATLFPQFNTPFWVIEGLAIFYESRLTGAGRLLGTHHEMILRTAALEDAFFPIDRATGAPIAWPGSATRYVYGSLFIAHLADRFGEERLAGFVHEFGRRFVPFRADAAARRSFGVSFSRAWQEWQDSLRLRYAALADTLRAQGLTEPEILTPEGRWALFPRVSPDGTRIAFSSATQREEASTRLVEPDGRQTVLAPQHTLDPLSWYPDGDALLTAEKELHGPYRLFSDLVRISADGGRQWLTREARLREPDSHPDGRRAVAIGHAPGTNRLLVVDLETGRETQLAEPSLTIHWAAPRWSPDGAHIAAARWRQGGFFDVVVLDTTGAPVRELTGDRAIDTDPAWSPDGRYVVFSSDRSGISNLYAFDLAADSLLQVTNLLTGGFQPDVSPDGEWIVFSYYGPRGYHVARVPFAPATWRPAPPVRESLAADPRTPLLPAAESGGPVRRYSPWPSLTPTGWLPQLESGTALGWGLGAALDGRDVIGRHLWSARGLVYARAARFDGRLDYHYRGWGNALLDASLAHVWEVARAGVPAVTPAGDTLRSDLFRREQRASLLAQQRWPRWRSVIWLGGGPDVRRLEHLWGDPVFTDAVPLRDFPVDLGLRLFGGFSSVRGYGYSISPEDGVLLQLSSEARRYARPFEGDEQARGYTRLLGVGQAYRGMDLGGFARHAVALRLAGGFEGGSSGPGFNVGGIGRLAVPLLLGLGVEGRQRTFGIRGFAPGAQVGDRALAASAEYRLPLLLVERGVRTWPFFFDRVWGALFAEAGSAWCAVDCEARFGSPPTGFTPLASIGAEAAASFVLGYTSHVSLRAGVALPLHDVPGWPRSPRLYLTTGRSF